MYVRQEKALIVACNRGNWDCGELASCRGIDSANGSCGRKEEGKTEKAKRYSRFRDDWFRAGKGMLRCSASVITPATLGGKVPLNQAERVNLEPLRLAIPYRIRDGPLLRGRTWPIQRKSSILLPNKIYGRSRESKEEFVRQVYFQGKEGRAITKGRSLCSLYYTERGRHLKWREKKIRCEGSSSTRISSCP